ncbi:unnamed protein product [Allacma fusca]|uniref:Uncharacterized protein n=1 Tax=Allacma fusca TaxID=39272 RepID=A0A8J2NVV7_9HEXA|nr:unnamed protein product [Allacma fusca]
MHLYSFPAIELVFSVLEILDEMKVGGTIYTTKNSLRTPSNFMKLYRELQVLNVNACNVYSPLALPATQWLFSIWIIFCIYGCIKFSGPFAFIMFVGAINVIVALVGILSLMAEVDVRSKQLLRSWNGHSKSDLLKHFIRSSQSIRLYIGTFYYIDHGMVLTMLKFISECTVNLIILY